MTCAPAKFEVATSNGIGGDAFTRKTLFDLDLGAKVIETFPSILYITSADPEEGTWAGKSQVIWVSIGNKILDTPTPLEKVGPPPPPPGKC